MYLPGYYINNKDKQPNKQLRDNANDTLTQLLKCAVALALVEPEEMVKSCLSCDFFNESIEGCGRSNNARPPARIIAFGCEAYENINDEIPF